jgi:hypothetical protein
MSLRFLFFHLVVAMASKKRVVLDLSVKVKVIEASETDKFSVKEIVSKFNVVKTQVELQFQVIVHLILPADSSYLRALNLDVFVSLYAFPFTRPQVDMA